MVAVPRASAYLPVEGNGMDGYLTRRLVTAPLLLLGLSLVLFLLLFIRPSNAMFSDITSIFTHVSMERYREYFGLDRPWYVQYGDWLWSALQGNLGESFTPPSAPGRDYPLLGVSLLTAWGLCLLIALARDIRNPMRGTVALSRDQTAAGGTNLKRRLSLLARPVP